MEMLQQYRWDEIQTGSHQINTSIVPLIRFNEQVLIIGLIINCCSRQTVLVFLLPLIDCRIYRFVGIVYFMGKLPQCDI